MTDPPSILRACANNPGDLTILLIAADFFAASDEGDDVVFERALRWMAANNKYPYRYEVTPQEGPAYYRWAWGGSKSPAVPATAQLPGDVAKRMGLWPMDTRTYIAFTLALIDLAENLPVPPPETPDAQT